MYKIVSSLPLGRTMSRKDRGKTQNRAMTGAEALPRFNECS